MIIQKIIRGKFCKIIKILTTLIYFLKENKGPSFCRNLGIDKSSSELIAFMDSDDFWPKDKLEKQINCMLKNNYNFTFTDYKFFLMVKLKI